MTAAQAMREVDLLADAEQATQLQRFFKTGPGEYGEGDVFAGVKVPQLRRIARAFRDLPLAEVDTLLASPVHEHRTVALVILTERAKRAGVPLRGELYDFYLARTAAIRNWDHVDLSCPDVVGGHLLARGDWRPLLRLAHSENLWERRIAIISTFKFIRAGDFAPTLETVTLLIDDAEDLIHKAVGWMLREVGKRDEAALRQFLSEHAAQLPRTALRYSVERMSPADRAYWRAQRAEQKEQPR